MSVFEVNGRMAAVGFLAGALIGSVAAYRLRLRLPPVVGVTAGWVTGAIAGVRPAMKRANPTTQSGTVTDEPPVLTRDLVMERARAAQRDHRITDNLFTSWRTVRSYRVPFAAVGKLVEHSLNSKRGLQLEHREGIYVGPPVGSGMWIDDSYILRQPNADDEDYLRYCDQALSLAKRLSDPRSGASQTEKSKFLQQLAVLYLSYQPEPLLDGRDVATVNVPEPEAGWLPEVRYWTAPISILLPPWKAFTAEDLMPHLESLDPFRTTRVDYLADLATKPKAPGQTDEGHVDSVVSAIMHAAVVQSQIGD